MRKCFRRRLDVLQLNTIDMEFDDDLHSWLSSLGPYGRRKMVFHDIENLWNRILDFVLLLKGP